jgi:hypothetical protein
VYISSPVNVPALRKAHQAQLAANARLFSPQSGVSVLAAYALTDLARIGATGTGSFPRSRRTGAYGELLGGVEPAINSFLAYGVFAAAGYGGADAHHPACRLTKDDDEGWCFVPADIVDQVTARYARYSLQGHFLVRAPRAASGGAGLRAGLTEIYFRRIEDAVSNRHSSFGTLEPFFFVRVGAPRFQVELQYRYVGLLGPPKTHGERLIVPENFMINAGMRIVLGPDP